MDVIFVNVEVGNYLVGLIGDVKGLCIVVLKEYLGEGVGEEVCELVLVVLKVLEGMGVIWEEVFFLYFKYVLVMYYLLFFFEVFVNFLCFDGVCYGVCFDNVNNLLDFYKNICSEGFGDEVKCRIMFGIFVFSFGYYDVYYKKV